MQDAGWQDNTTIKFGERYLDMPCKLIIQLGSSCLLKLAYSFIRLPVYKWSIMSTRKAYVAKRIFPAAVCGSPMWLMPCTICVIECHCHPLNPVHSNITGNTHCSIHIEQLRVSSRSVQPYDQPSTTPLYASQGLPEEHGNDCNHTSLMPCRTKNAHMLCMYINRSLFSGANSR